MIGFAAGRGLLYDVHPWTALVVAISLSSAAMVVPGLRGAAWVLGAVLLVAGVGAWRAIRPALLLAAPFWVFLLAIHWAIRHQPEVGVTLAARLTAIIVAVVSVVTALSPARMVEAMAQARLPFGLVYVWSATFQAIPRLQAHAHAILEAQQCRGMVLGRRLSRRARAFAPLVVPLVLGALAEVDERAVALETRGAAPAVRRTSLHPPRWQWRDTFVVVLCAVLVVGVVWGRLR